MKLHKFSPGKVWIISRFVGRKSAGSNAGHAKPWRLFRMNMKNIILRDTFAVDADYDKIVAFVKLKLDDTYYKGRIDKDELQLFYSSGILKKPLSPHLPIIQLNIKNKLEKDGRIKIRFKIVDFALILFGLANLIILFFSQVNIHRHGPNPVPEQVPLVLLPFSFGLLFLLFSVERSAFRKEIEQLELRK